MSEFEREDRYLVVKIKDLKDVPRIVRERLLDELATCNKYMTDREYVCIESDWPEYELVWKMIQDRIEGRTPDQSTQEVSVDECIQKACAILKEAIDKKHRTGIDNILAGLLYKVSSQQKVVDAAIEWQNFTIEETENKLWDAITEHQKERK